MLVVVAALALNFAPRFLAFAADTFYLSASKFEVAVRNFKPGSKLAILAGIFKISSVCASVFASLFICLFVCLIVSSPWQKVSNFVGEQSGRSNKMNK